MFFKSASVGRIAANFQLDQDKLVEQLEQHQFVPCGQLDIVQYGWVPVRENGGLAHVVNGQLLLKLCTEKKSIPGAVVKDLAKKRFQEFETEHGFKPGRKAKRDIEEQVRDEILPRVLGLKSYTSVWIDPKNRLIVIETTSQSKADNVYKLLMKMSAMDGGIESGSIRCERDPMSCMTEWLASGEAPAGFTVDNDAELIATGEKKSKVRYMRHTVDTPQVKQQIAEGKRCTKLAMTWADRISFVLTEQFTIKSIEPLDVLKESADQADKDADERFDGDFMLMTGELVKLIGDLTVALGGETQPEEKVAEAA